MLHATHQRMTLYNPVDVRMPLLLLLLPHRIIPAPSQHRHDIHIRYPYTGGLQRLKSLSSQSLVTWIFFFEFPDKGPGSQHIDQFSGMILCFRFFFDLHCHVWIIGDNCSYSCIDQPFHIRFFIDCPDTDIQIAA